MLGDENKGMREPDLVADPRTGTSYTARCLDPVNFYNMKRIPFQMLVSACG